MGVSAKIRAMSALAVAGIASACACACFSPFSVGQVCAQEITLLEAGQQQGCPDGDYSYSAGASTMTVTVEGGAVVGITIAGEGQVTPGKLLELVKGCVEATGVEAPSPAGTYLLDAAEPYVTPYHYKDYSSGTFSMGGEAYTHGFTCMGYGNSDEGGNVTIFNLQGKYSTLSFTAGTVDPGGAKSVRFSVIADGECVAEVEMGTNDLPVECSADITGCRQLKICVYDGNSTAMYSGTYGIANLVATEAS